MRTCRVDHFGLLSGGLFHQDAVLTPIFARFVDIVLRRFGDARRNHLNPQILQSRRDRPRFIPTRVENRFFPSKRALQGAIAAYNSASASAITTSARAISAGSPKALTISLMANVVSRLP